MNSSIEIDITPDKSLIQKLGLVGYRTEQAIAELLDNAIDGRLPDSKESIRVRLDAEMNQIEVEDDGCGMSRQDLINAMTIGKGTKTAGKLGRFGIGMKSACSALGKKFTVTTSKIGSDREYRVTYDEESWLSDSSQDWKNFVLEEKTLAAGEQWHGTKITISKLNIRLYPNLVTKFKDSFGMRYFPYLETEQISIQVNTILCKHDKPEIVEGSRRDVHIDLEFGRKIDGHVALLKKRSMEGNYGINLFKNGRLIKPFEKFGFSAHPENSRIIGELSLDFVPVNFSKSEFITESKQYVMSLESFRLSSALKQIMRSSKSGGKNTVSIQSIFDYFGGTSEPQFLERRMRADVSKDLLDGTLPFETEFEGYSMQIEIRPLAGQKLYSIKHHGSKIKVIINKDNKAFEFVKNPLFLIGMIASEVKLLVKNSGLGESLDKRNDDINNFLVKWSKRNDDDLSFRHRDVKTPNVRGYKLADELVEVHDYLKARSQARFQFTAFSTLIPYLHNLLGRFVYTIYTIPWGGDIVYELLWEKFRHKFTIVPPSSKRDLETFFNMGTADQVISIRTYAVIPGSTIATPEKAYVDLVNETYGYTGQVDEQELRRMFRTMNLLKLIDQKKLWRYARQIKKTKQLKEILEIE